MIIKINPLEETTTYELRNFESVKSFLAHRQEGIFGIEYYKDKTVSKKQFFAHRLVRLNLQRVKPTLLDTSRTDVDCYFVVFKEPSYMPFQFKGDDLWWLISKYTDRYINKANIYIQTTFQYCSQQEWKEHGYHQYNAYLDGIENPSTNKLIRGMQYKIAYVFQNLIKKPYAIPEVIEKLEQNGYYIWNRIMILGDEDTRKRIIEKIQLAFNQIAYTNHWRFIKADNVKLFMENMQMRIPNRQYKNILCPDEMIAFLGGNNEQTQTGEEIEQTITMPEVAVTTEPETVGVDHVEVKNYGEIGDSDKEIIADLEWAMRRAKILDKQEHLDIVDIKDGATLKFISFMRPEGLKLTTIQRAIEDMELDLHVRGLGIEQGSVRGSIAITYPRKQREYIQLESLIDTPEFKQFTLSAELPLILGVDTVGNPIFFDLVKMIHVLIAGTTGSGKSVFLNCLLIVLTWLISPKMLKLYLIDPKQVELQPYAVLPHVPNGGYTTNPDKARKIYEKQIDIMEKRYTELAKHGVKNITQYNAKFPDNKWDYIVIVTDEFADLTMQVDVDDVVVRLGQKARACGIHLILATQRPEAKVISGLLKNNLPTKISFALPSHTDYQTVYGKMIPFRLLGKGDGVFNTIAFETKAEFNRFQAPYGDEDLSKILDKWGSGKQSEFKDEIEPEEEDEEEEVDEKYEELKRIICETKETRVSELRKKTRMNQTKLSDYIKQLVDDGWLEKGETRQAGYKLLLGEDDIEEYLGNG